MLWKLQEGDFRTKELGDRNQMPRSRSEGNAVDLASRCSGLCQIIVRRMMGGEPEAKGSHHLIKWEPCLKAPLGLPRHLNKIRHFPHELTGLHDLSLVYLYFIT